MMCSQIAVDIGTVRLAAMTASSEQGGGELQAKAVGNQAANEVREQISHNLSTAYADVYGIILTLDDAASELMAQTIAVPETPAVAED
jgi:hypothetical protein